MYKAVACLVQLHTSYRLPGMLAGQPDVLLFANSLAIYLEAAFDQRNPSLACVQ